jgi:ComF family protein
MATLLTFQMLNRENAHIFPIFMFVNLAQIKQIGQGIIHLFYPRLCEGCSKPLIAGEEVLCISCAVELPETNYHNIADNETALRFAGRIPFKHATTLAYFTNDGLLQHLLHGLKYKGKKEIGFYLGRRLGLQLRNTEWIDSIDQIVPVPLHIKKQHSRGFNQSAMIAQGISSVTNLPVTEGILTRVRNTETQTHKTRTERVNNMEGAFTVSQPGTITNKHILLCDDVLTTGATLEACALALLAEKGVKISIASIGIAVS